MRVRYYVMMISLLILCCTVSAQTAQERKGGVYYAYHAPDVRSPLFPRVLNHSTSLITEDMALAGCHPTAVMNG